MTAVLVCCALAMLVAGEGWWLLWVARDRRPKDRLSQWASAIDRLNWTIAQATYQQSELSQALSGAEGTEQQG